MSGSAVGSWAALLAPSTPRSRSNVAPTMASTTTTPSPTSRRGDMRATGSRFSLALGGRPPRLGEGDGQQHGDQQQRAERRHDGRAGDARQRTGVRDQGYRCEQRQARRGQRQQQAFERHRSKDLPSRRSPGAAQGQDAAAPVGEEKNDQAERGRRHRRKAGPQHCEDRGYRAPLGLVGLRSTAAGCSGCPASGSRRCRSWPGRCLRRRNAAIRPASPADVIRAGSTR